MWMHEAYYCNLNSDGPKITPFTQHNWLNLVWVISVSHQRKEFLGQGKDGLIFPGGKKPCNFKKIIVQGRLQALVRKHRVFQEVS